MAHTLTGDPSLTAYKVAADMAVDDAVLAFAQADMEIAMAQAMGVDCEAARPSVVTLSVMQRAGADGRGIPSDPYTTPRHDIMLDQYIAKADKDGLTIKVVAYRMDLEIERDNGAECVRIPEDDIDNLLSIVGTLTVMVHANGRMDVIPEGDFATDEEVKAAVARINAVNPQ